MKINTSQAQKLSALQAAYRTNEIESNKVALEINEKINELAFKLFDKWTELKDDLNRLDESKDFGNDESGIYRWTRTTIDLKRILELGLSEALTRYLEDEGVTIDFKNDALSYYEGPSLILCEDGEIYDQDSCKRILKRDDYLDDDGEASKEILKEKLEQWREKNGYFPALFREDHYGNVFLTNL